MKKNKANPPIGFLSLFLISIVLLVLNQFYPTLNMNLALKSNDGPRHFLLHLITHMLVHANMMHLAGNFMFGGPLAVYLERKVGTVKFLCLWFITGLCGAGFFMLMPSIFGWMGLLGSSGAIAGVVAYALMSANENSAVRLLSLTLLVFLLLMQCSSMMITIVLGGGVAYAAHFGAMLSAIILYAIFDKK